MFSQTLEHGNSKNENDTETDEKGNKRGVSMERSKAGTKEKRSPNGQNYPYQNTIIINIISSYFIRDCKSITSVWSLRKIVESSAEFLYR